ncbi:MAG: imidazole glycerol phosphate synthase subunit HisH [Chloroflexi bacterium]|nr:imidazole glycerol phosphate synthase subunit HisH [Chloroflexota bacterium]
MQIAILDYGAGNLRSVAKAFATLGRSTVVTSQASEMLASDVAILPGVGSARDAMAGLAKAGLADPVREFIASGRPLFGVCLGLQLLLTESEEEGGTACLDVFSGRVRRLPAGLKVPHMGWNQVLQRRPHPIFAGIPDNAYFYFVHSYYADPEESGLVFGETEYGIPFCSVVIRDNLVATQFHPEKSGRWGLRLYENFLKWIAAA